MTSTTPRRIALFTLLFIFLAVSGGQAAEKMAKPFIPPAARPVTAPTTATAAPALPSAPSATSPSAAQVDDYAAAGPTDAPAVPVPDPFYGWNKFWFTFNDVFYSVLMRPLANGYAFVMPQMIRTGLANAYQNFVFPIRFVNSLFQLDVTKASREFGRFMINTTLGVGGLMDVAKADPNLQPGNEDFGQTLGHYGMSEGCYIVWPLLGPSTVRDSIGLAGDALANPLTWIFGPWTYGDYNPWYWSYIIKGGDLFNRLPVTIEEYDGLVKPAIEPYSAVKDAFIQYRRNAVAH